LKKKLQKLFNLQEDDIIIITNTFDYQYSITAIIKQSKFNEYSTFNLKEELTNDEEFKKIIAIEKKILLSGCILNPYMFDYKANNKDPGWGKNEFRGGFPYYPPHGWVGYGIRVADRYDNGNNSWLDYNHSKGEWSVAYHGIGSGFKGSQIYNYNNNYYLMNSLIPGMRQQFKDKNDFLHIGKKVGEGIIVTPKPEIMEQNCGIFDCYGIKYKIGFMTRVMPKKIRCSEGQDDYWAINGTDNEIRPYRSLIKEL
jgi:hypothetical protein